MRASPERRYGRLIAGFFRRFQTEIVAEWEPAARSLSAARDLPRPTLIDHIPSLLDRIVEIADQFAAGQSTDLPKDTAERHVLERPWGGFDLSAVIAELSLLRDCVLRIWQRERRVPGDYDEVRILNQVIDKAVATLVDRQGTERMKGYDPEQPRLLAVIADSVPLLISYIDRDFRYQFNNKAYEVWFGRSRDEIRGKHVREILGEAAFARVRPYMEAALTGKAVSYQQELPYQTAGTRYIEATYTPDLAPDGSVTGMVAIVTDISSTKQAEEAQRFLSEASKQLAESLDYEATLAKISHLAVPMIADWCVVYLAQKDGAIRRVSVAHVDPAKEQLAQELGRRYPPNREAPHGIPHVIRTGKAEFVPEIHDSGIAKFAVDAEHLRILRELGFKSSLIVPIASRGRTLGAIAMITAESGRRYGEADLILAEDLARRAAVAIENARLYREAQEAIRLREEVLAVVSHDLKNPLGAINMSATLLMKKALSHDPRTRKQVETIQRSAVRMEHLIGDLLDMASIQAGRLSIEKRSEEIRAIASEALDSHGPMAKEGGLNLRHELLESGFPVMCDRERILQVLGNLLGNAIKFSGVGDSITLRIEPKEHEVVISVADTGPGIPEDELPHIFEPYWTTRRQGKKGTGLGLYITKGIVEAHGGRIWVESKLGVGTTFSFTLPRA